MQEWTARSRALLGDGSHEKLAAARVAVFGLGGVGSYAAEALARAGIGAFALIDGDIVAESNINRQLIALRSTVGRRKAEVMKERIADINPAADVDALFWRFCAEEASRLDFAGFDYIIDAIDDIPAKVALIKAAQAAGTPMISAMGAGNKLDPARFIAADIYDTKICPLARAMRSRLRAEGIERLRVVYSPEEPLSPAAENGLRVTGSVSFVPGAAGLLMAAEAVKHILGIQAD